MAAPMPGIAQSAASTQTLSGLISGFYTPYLKVGAEPPDSLGVIASHATPALRTLIAQDDACQRRTQGICNIDFDPIIGAQDWDLHHQPPEIKANQPTPDEILVFSTFINDGATTKIEYVFQKIDGIWLIADVAGQNDGAPAWHLGEILSRAN